MVGLRSPVSHAQFHGDVTVASRRCLLGRKQKQDICKRLYRDAGELTRNLTIEVAYMWSSWSRLFVDSDTNKISIGLKNLRDETDRSQLEVWATCYDIAVGDEHTSDMYSLKGVET